MYEGGMSAQMLAQYFAVSLGEIYRVLREGKTAFKNTRRRRIR